MATSAFSTSSSCPTVSRAAAGNRAHDIASVVQASQCSDEMGVGFLLLVGHDSTE
jgi:hypothetical protein